MIITINNLERKTENDEVIVCHWNASLTDGDYSASAYGTQSFTRDENSPTFIAFDALTETTSTNLNGDTVQHKVLHKASSVKTGE